MHDDPKFTLLTVNVVELAEKFETALAAVRTAQAELSQSTEPEGAALRAKVVGLLGSVLAAMNGARVLGRAEAAHGMLEVLRAKGRAALLRELEGDETLH